MTRVSKRPLRKDLEERMFHIFWQSFIELKNEKDVVEFLEDLLSPAEKIMLAKRLAIVLLLEKGWGYDEISSTLKVSTTTINFMRQKQAILGRGFKKAIHTILQQEDMSTFLAELAVSVTSVLYPKGNMGLRSIPRDVAEAYRRKNRKQVL